jgi:hypothetical protein
MRTGLSAILTLLCLVVVVPRADAGKHEFEAAKVSVDVPSGWAIHDEGGTVTFASPDETLAVNLAVATGMDPDAAWDLLLSEVAKVVSGFAADKAPGVLGSLTGQVGHGAGSMGGTPVEALVAVFPIDGGSMTLFAIGEKGKYEKHEKAMTQLLDGLAPSGGGGGFLADDDAYAGLGADGQKFAARLATAIGKNDGKGFVKLVGKKGLTFADGDRGRKVKTSKVKGAIKKAGSVAAFLGLPAAGELHVSADASDPTTFSLYRGELSSVVTYVVARKVKGKWSVEGTYLQDHGVDDL